MTPSSQPHQITALRHRWEVFALAIILLAAAAWNFFQLAQNGFGNTYYAAAVKSMLTSWHNLFFASYDPVGFVSVDKPPLGFWVQAASAAVFGFDGLWLMLPQAVAGVASVGLLYVLVRKTGSSVAALIVAALLAISPVNVVVNRSNIFESLVVLTLLAATWCVLRATALSPFGTKRRSLAWLLAGGALVGLGFNIKGLEAWLILPALAVTYACAAPLAVRLRLRNLMLMAGVTLIVSVAWLVVVDRVPAEQRPYVDSTLTNSELDLMLNYNGLQRLVGEPGYNGKAPVIKHNKGDPGPVRLFQPPLGGQVSWFLPLAIIGMLATGWGINRAGLRAAWLQRHLLPSQAPSQAALLLWGGWLITAGGFFSVALRFNEYYLAVLAPAVCALAGYGIAAVWEDRARSNWRGWLFVLAFGLTGVEQLYILSGYPDWGATQTPLLVGVCVVGVALLVNSKLLLRMLDPTNRSRGLLQTVSAAAWLMLLIVPLRWTVESLTPQHSGEFPIAGPAPLTRGNTIVPEPDPVLIAYLNQRMGQARFLIATTSVEDASAIYLKTGRAAMAMGGFSGYDPILTPDTLAARVASGELRFFLIPAGNLTTDQAQALYPDDFAAADPPFTTHITNDLTGWISANCAPVAPVEWQTTPSLGMLQLFNCALQH